MRLRDYLLDKLEAVRVRIDQKMDEFDEAERRAALVEQITPPRGIKQRIRKRLEALSNEVLDLDWSRQDSLALKQLLDDAQIPLYAGARRLSPRERVQVTLAQLLEWRHGTRRLQDKLCRQCFKYDSTTGDPDDCRTCLKSEVRKLRTHVIT